MDVIPLKNKALEDARHVVIVAVAVQLLQLNTLFLVAIREDFNEVFRDQTDHTDTTHPTTKFN